MRMNRFAPLFLLTALPAMAASPADPAAPPPAPTPTSTLQSRFDAARQLLDAKKYPEALEAFSVLEKDMLAAPKVSSQSLAFTRLFRAQVFYQLSRFDEARAILEPLVESRALAKPATQSFHQEAEEKLASLLAFQFEDQAAAGIFERLAGGATVGLEKRIYLARQAVALQLLDPNRAVLVADQALALTLQESPDDKKFRASVLNIKGRALLNAGRLKEAREVLNKAITLRGGLDSKIDRSEYAMRADAGLAALQEGDKESARRLLAFTGMGRTPVFFPRGVEMTPPPCGGEEGLKPEDWAVIQFMLNESGAVIASTPVFASRQGPMGYVFARALRDWRWAPTEIAKISPFYLSQLRIEMRCTTAGSGRPSAIDRNDTAAWLTGQSRPETAQIAKDLEKGRDLGLSDTVRREAYQHALAQLKQAGAPPSAWLPVAVADASIHSAVSRAAYGRETAAALTPLLTTPELVQSYRDAHHLRLHIAAQLNSAKTMEAEQKILDEILADGRLTEKDPIRIAALLATANLAVRKKDLAAAEQAYQKTGLTARQCAALDRRPVVAKSNVSSVHFPAEAMYWGFEGWVTLEFDIDANGKTMGSRPLISFPPSIFNTAGVSAFKAVSYQPSFRPDGGPGCAAHSESISFKLGN